NTVAVVDEVRTTLATLKGQIPSDVHVAAYYDQSLLVRDSISSVRDAIIIGLLLSIVILYAFLRNWGTTFVAILVIPVTILVTILTGVTGVFFRSLALTMSVALLTSLVLALGFTPVLAEKFVRAKPRKKGEPAGEVDDELTRDELEEEAESGRVLRAIISRYEWVLSRALDNRWIIIAIIAAVLVGSYLIYSGLGSE